MTRCGKLQKAIAAEKGTWKGVVRFRPAPGEPLSVDLLKNPEDEPSAKKMTRRRAPAGRARDLSSELGRATGRNG